MKRADDKGPPTATATSQATQLYVLPTSLADCHPPEKAEQAGNWSLSRSRPDVRGRQVIKYSTTVAYSPCSGSSTPDEVVSLNSPMGGS